MKNKKNLQPCIDYKTARALDHMYDFINHANQMRKDIWKQLDFMDRSLSSMQNKISEMKEWFQPVDNPNAGIGNFENDMEALRTHAWEAGLTTTLFEKLKDKEFSKRFTGRLHPPVQKEEIEDDDDAKA